MTAEDVRVRLRSKLESAFGAEEASILMDRPPGGWNDLVTSQMLDARLSALEQRLLAQMADLRCDVQTAISKQTWRLASALLATVTITVTAMTAILRVT
jgi:hypothetical protein